MTPKKEHPQRAGRKKTTVAQKLEKIVFDVDKVKKIARFGCTDRQLAQILNVSPETIKVWKRDSPEFLTALKEAKDEADSEVERSLYERAMGYSHKADKIFCNASGETTIVPYDECYPPDATSMIFWLKNRQPDKWRDKHEMDIGEKTFEFIIGQNKEND